jgi:hypothetical protein
MKTMIDEQERTDAFERACGSIARAQRLHSIYKNTYGNGPVYGPSKIDRFRRKAEADGFTDAQVNALLLLQ